MNYSITALRYIIFDIKEISNKTSYCALNE